MENGLELASPLHACPCAILRAGLAVFLVCHRSRQQGSLACISRKRSHSKESAAEIDSVPIWVRSAPSSSSRQGLTLEANAVYAPGPTDRTASEEAADVIPGNSSRSFGNSDDLERRAVYVPASKRIEMDATLAVVPGKLQTQQARNKIWGLEPPPRSGFSSTLVGGSAISAPPVALFPRRMESCMFGIDVHKSDSAMLSRKVAGLLNAHNVTHTSRRMGCFNSRAALGDVPSKAHISWVL
jgi:hypothetical protein